VPYKPIRRPIDRLYDELVRTGGNVSAAAKALRMDVREARRLAKTTERLMDAALEAAERALDEAEAAIYAGLDHPDKQKRVLAASQILRLSPGARRRKW
jgi:hypothetical protein